MPKLTLTSLRKLGGKAKWNKMTPQQRKEHINKMIEGRKIRRELRENEKLLESK